MCGSFVLCYFFFDVIVGQVQFYLVVGVVIEVDVVQVVGQWYVEGDFGVWVQFGQCFVCIGVFQYLVQGSGWNVGFVEQVVQGLVVLDVQYLLVVVWYLLLVGYG